VGCAARGAAEPPQQAEPEDLPRLLLALARGGPRRSCAGGSPRA
jgi:hypothetical protein